MLKVGDKCRLIDTSGGAILGFSKNDIVTIKNINKNDLFLKITIKNSIGIVGYVDKDQLELIKEDKKLMKLGDLKTGDILTLKNGEKVLFIDNEDNEENFVNLEESNINNLYEKDDLEENLTCFYDSDYDVVKVERAETYETVYTRESRKMTVTEICKELGYDVEIVKEEI